MTTTCSKERRHRRHALQQLAAFGVSEAWAEKSPASKVAHIQRQALAIF